MRNPFKRKYKIKNIDVHAIDQLTHGYYTRSSIEEALLYANGKWEGTLRYLLGGSISRGTR